ncbi:Transcription factor IBH1 [Rhynchospora pubera]|uniref:Transcription factor IBH1 n=1 Tax=Rhynchospora pubera TaxID=906938 RepID=A0AAV8GXH8_9POAL|nr:Transcription factor IBH1 [Rhynchospora pubera]
MNRKNPLPNSNPNSPNSSMQALHFLQALARIARAAPKPAHSARTRQIRHAAYASMAHSSRSSRRTWSRALLHRLRQRQRPGRLLTVRRRVRIVTPIMSRPEEPARAETLRQLVPGGRGMEYCNLLEETADYVQCLRAQVQLMQTLLDAFSS